jgi:hypothetical protein
MSRPRGSRNKAPPSKNVAPSTKRKRWQRVAEAAVELHEFLAAEAELARASGTPEACVYQGTQPKILGERFERAAARLKRKRTE